MNAARQPDGCAMFYRYTVAKLVPFGICRMNLDHLNIKAPASMMEYLSQLGMTQSFLQPPSATGIEVVPRCESLIVGCTAANQC